MTDRKLLELAAKAAGIEVWPGAGAQALMLFTRPDKSDPSGKVTGVAWNPLTDDGDALRLAVKLEMQECIGVRRIDAVIVGDEDGQVFRGTEAKAGDICAATRRAIVRAAAEIGKARSD
ncbi:hypothetical protein [Achromobacter aegrifaciens]